MTDRLSIRRYEPRDANAVWRVHERAFEAAPIPFLPEPDRDLRQIPAAYLDDGVFLVGTVEGGVVAIGGFQRADAATVEVKRMRVDPAVQRRGCGGAVLEALEGRARTRGYERAVLHTSERLTAALSFYRARGYWETEREPHPEAGFDLVYLEKQL